MFRITRPIFTLLLTFLSAQLIWAKDQSPTDIPWRNMDAALGHYGGEIDNQLHELDRKAILITLREVAWTEGALRVLKVVRKHEQICPIYATNANINLILDADEALRDTDEENMAKVYGRLWDRLSPDGVDNVVT